MRSFTWEQVWGHRLRSHALTRPVPAEKLTELVGAVCGIHAQVNASAELSIGQRVLGVTGADVRKALWEQRTLTRTYGIRGTVHLFPTRELPLWMAAMRAAGGQTGGRQLDVMGVDQAQFDAMVQAVGEALAGRCLTRQDLSNEVARRLGSWVLEETFPAWGGMWPRVWLAIRAAASAGLLCFGPSAGNRVTFVNPREWIGDWKDVDGGEALMEVCRRFLHAYGPATHQQFGQWFYLRPGPSLAVFRSFADELEEVDVEGGRAWILADDSDDSWEPAPDSIRLLPSFDCYVIGSHPRVRLIPRGWADGRGLTSLPDGARTGKDGLDGPLPVVVAGGVVAGMWERRNDARGRIEVRVEPFAELTARQRGQLEAEAYRVGEILGLEATFTLGRASPPLAAGRLKL